MHNQANQTCVHQMSKGQIITWNPVGMKTQNATQTLAQPYLPHETIKACHTVPDPQTKLQRAKSDLDVQNIAPPAILHPDHEHTKPQSMAAGSCKSHNETRMTDPMRQASSEI